MTLVLLDTNFLMVPEQFGIDIFSEIERIVPDCELVTLKSVILELEKIREHAGKGRDKIAAGVALKLIEKFNEKIKIVESSGNVDEFILKFSMENKAIVCTNDKKLKKRLKKEGIGVIQMRGKSRLEFL